MIKETGLRKIDALVPKMIGVLVAEGHNEDIAETVGRIIWKLERYLLDTENVEPLREYILYDDELKDRVRDVNSLLLSALIDEEKVDEETMFEDQGRLPSIFEEVDIYGSS